MRTTIWLKKKQDVDAMLDRLLEGKRPEEIVGGGGLLEDLASVPMAEQIIRLRPRP